MGGGACSHGWAPFHSDSLYLEGEWCGAYVNSLNWVVRVLLLVLVKVRLQTCPWDGICSWWIIDAVSLEESVHSEGYIFSGDVRHSVMSIISIKRDSVMAVCVIHYTKIQIKTKLFNATTLLMLYTKQHHHPSHFMIRLWVMVADRSEISLLFSARPCGLGLQIQGGINRCNEDSPVHCATRPLISPKHEKTSTEQPNVK